MRFTFSNNPISKLKCWYWNKKEDISQVIWQKGKRKIIKCRICGKVLDSLKEEYSPIQCGWHKVSKYSWICHMCFDHRNFRPFIEAIDEADRKRWEEIKDKETNMKSYGFLVAHGYELWKGYLDAESEEDAKQKILRQEWDDITDEYDTSKLTVGYEVREIWRIE